MPAWALEAIRVAGRLASKAWHLVRGRAPETVDSSQIMSEVFRRFESGELIPIDHGGMHGAGSDGVITVAIGTNCSAPTTIVGPGSVSPPDRLIPGCSSNHSPVGESHRLSCFSCTPRARRASLLGQPRLASLTLRRAPRICAPRVSSRTTPSRAV